MELQRKLLVRHLFVTSRYYLRPAYNVPNVYENESVYLTVYYCKLIVISTRPWKVEIYQVFTIRSNARLDYAAMISL
jgi:hypothetical protein